MYHLCMPTHHPTIGRQMKIRRATRDLTQADLGKLVRASRQTIMSIETELTNPGFDLAFRISRALGFSLDKVIPNDRPYEKE